MPTALELLRDDETPASSLLGAADAVLGDEWRVWEPETVWLELHHKRAEISLGNRQQLMAARNVLSTGRCYYDALVFARTATAFSNEESNFDSFDEMNVAHMAWCIDELAKIEGSSHEFDREVVQLVAIALFDEGFVLAPEQLQFAQEALDARYPKDTSALKSVVEEYWTSLREHREKEFSLPENAKGVQLARLLAVDTYVMKRRAARARLTLGA